MDLSPADTFMGGGCCVCDVENIIQGSYGLECSVGKIKTVKVLDFVMHSLRVLRGSPGLVGAELIVLQNY